MDGYGLGEHPYPIEDRDTILGGLDDRRCIRYGGMDQDLVVRAQHGDQRALESLVVASHLRLYRLAQGILGSPHLEEDATQQARLDIWRDIRRLRDLAKFEGWSYRIFVRCCYREAKRRPKWSSEAEIQPADKPRVMDVVGAVLDHDQLERGFQRLPVDQQAAALIDASSRRRAVRPLTR
jgi:DNA-directed RNA polymerase specialized sigma24 family protein